MRRITPALPLGGRPFTHRMGPSEPSIQAEPRISAKRRLRLARGLRTVASRTSEGARRGRFEVLLRDRAAAVRTDLLEIAAMLETTADPDPVCVTELHRLLTDGCESPLYNRDVHPSELQATLYYARARLT
jgi:hypothetical protein